MRVREQALADVRRRRERAAREQGGRRRVVEAGERERRHAGGLERAQLALARAEQQRDALRVEPPGHELQRVRGPGVEPVGVVDDAQHRFALRELGEQREAGRVDEEALLAAALLQPERGPQRGRLRRGQAVEPAQRGPQQLVQGRERQLGLRLDAPCHQHLHAGRLLARVIQQRGLAGAGLAAQHERAAARRAGRVQ